MQWPVPPKVADNDIVAAISAPAARDVLRALATETASIITLARMWHDQDKKARREAWKQVNTETGEIENFDQESESLNF